MKKMKIWTILLVLAMLLTLVVGCADSKGPDAGKEKLDYKNIMIGETCSLVVNDEGWGQAIHESLVRALEELGIPKENLIVIENVAGDKVAVQNAYDALVSEGVDLIIGGSASHAPFLSDIVAENPGVVVAQQSDKMDNLIGYQIRNYEGMFVAGYLSALMADGDLLGFAGSASEASVRAAVNGYALGARYANPNAKVQLVWSNSWYDVDLETQSAKTLIGQGIEYMGGEYSSPAIPQTCEANGAYCIGYHLDIEALAPGAILTSFVWNFTPIFKEIITSVIEGTSSPDDYYFWGGECASLAGYNNALVPEDIQIKAEKVKADLADGTIVVFGGELRDNKGNILVQEGEVMNDSDINTQEFLVENVLGTW